MYGKLKLITSNEKYDFYATQKLGKTYYTIAMKKGTTERVTMAGFMTKADAIKCGSVWAGWMK